MNFKFLQNLHYEQEKVLDYFNQMKQFLFHIIFTKIFTIFLIFFFFLLFLKQIQNITKLFLKN